jgi:hypothetical protein
VKVSSAGRRAAANLVARVRPIWPEPVELHVSRNVLPGRRDGQDYLVLPALRRPVLLVPAGRRAAAGAIVRFDEGQRARLLLRLLAGAQRTGLLRRLPVARVSVGPADDGGVLQEVRKAVPGADAIVVRLGRPRHGRAVILNALDTRGRSVAFAKCAWGVRVADLEQERDNLAAVAHDQIPGVRAPEVLAFVRLEDSAALVLEALTPKSPATGESGLPVEAMKALAGCRGWQRTSVSDSEVVKRLRDGIAAVRDEQARSWLQSELDRMVSELGDVETRAGSWHGDWVPWNMARDGTTILLWDWEHHEPGVPPGFDHLHYLAQELRLRVGTSPDVEDSWLDAARAALAQHWDERGAAAEAAVRAYLLVVNLRYVADREGDPEGSSERSGWTRELLQRLGDEPVRGVST